MTTPLDPTLRVLDDCGCCAGLGVSTPGVVFNRPGLSAITYRIGTWHEFKQSLLAALAGANHPALAGLTTRADDDFTIAFLDAVAVVADSLTFYQERIANESYLRTATERVSVLELARLIGYEFRPGVAASTTVAFTLETAAGAPPAATVDIGVKVQSVPGQDERPQTFETIEKLDARAEWNAMRPKLTVPQALGMNSGGAWLAGTATNLKVGDAVLLMDPNRGRLSTDEHWDLRRVRRVAPDSDNERTRIEWERGLGSRTPPMTPAPSPMAYALRTRASLFGYNAIDPKLLTSQVAGKFADAGELEVVDDLPRWKFDLDSRKISLDSPYASIRAGTWVVFATPTYLELYHVDFAAESGQSKFGMSAKTTSLTLATSENLTEQFSGENLPKTVVFGEPELLPLDEEPADAELRAGSSSLVVSTDVGDIPKGRRVIVAGTDLSGAAVAETVAIDHTDVVRGSRGGESYQVRRLVFATTLRHSYRLDTVTIYGNVALATHGETVTEVLGSGDASRPYQRFTLRQPPLTFVRDKDSPTGAVSTLSIRVNDLLWQEVPSFFGRGPTERIYTTRRSDDGTTVVQFGDGVHGARLPTGRENVRAVYRKGVGTGANVRRGQLTTLLSRPLGTKDALNPVPGSGGADPEPRDAARENAPLTVLTLDRVVSLRDYEDFARSYVGIAKALATWSWDGERRGVLITVAGPDGVPVAEEVRALLLAAIRASGDPHVPLRVASYRPATFRTTFKVKVDPEHVRATVHAGIVASLRTRFGFGARAFGQPVALSEVIATVQAVAGVTATDVDSLVRTDGIGGNGLLNPLPAALPAAASLTGTQAAELLTLAGDAITPGEMS